MGRRPKRCQRTRRKIALALLEGGWSSQELAIKYGISDQTIYRYRRQFLAGIARQIADTGQPIPRPACLVAGGETTVTVTGDGLGGRNQELALGAVERLAGILGATLVCLATDGGDGPTDAAGAVVTGETLWRARRMGMDPAEFLRRNDAYHFFKPLGDLLHTGPTLTNVNDLAFLFLH